MEDYLGPDALSIGDIRDGAIRVNLGGVRDDGELSDKVERRVASCMKDRGFEYIPLIGVDPGPGAVEEIASLSTDEFVAEFGYGLSTMLDVELEPVEDPNDEIRSALSAGATIEYDRARYGEPESSRPGGCVGSAIDAVAAEEEALLTGGGSEQWSSLHEDLLQLAERVLADPRVADANREWASCMEDAGLLGVSEVRDARLAVGHRMNELLHIPGTERQKKLTGIDDSSIDELQDFERRVATSDLECRIGHYDGVLVAVQSDHEESFVVENVETLEQYRTWINSNANNN